MKRAITVKSKVAAQEPSQETQEPSQETQEVSQETQEVSQETQEVSQETQEPTQAVPKVRVKVTAPITVKKKETKDTDTASNYSYLGKTIEDTYKSKDLWFHIYSDPDTYAGAIDPQGDTVWYYDEESKCMVQGVVNFMECFFKIFDETLVNAIDQHYRLKSLIDKGHKLRPVTKIQVNIDETVGLISVENDGEGLDVVRHQDPKFEGKYVPQVIMGELLTSANYGDEERTVGGKNGYGAKITNIFSKEFTIETVDSVRKLHYKQTWRDNMRVVETPIVTPYTKAPFTKITYLPDYARFKVQNPAVLDDWKIIKKRVYDAAACTESTVSVYLNGTKIGVKTFEDYINLYIGNKNHTKRVYAQINPRWKVAVCLSPDGEAEQVSFVNGISTDRGGKHVDHVLKNLCDKVIEHIPEKDKKNVTLKPGFVKANLFVFVQATIVNPRFDTQTKRKLTSLVKDFGSRCDLSEDFIKSVIKLGILDRAKKLAEFKAREDLGKKTDGRSGGRICHPKLHDVANRSNAQKCTMFFTEGDSAASFISNGIRGIPEEKRAFWGWFPLRGKMLNVRHATLKQLASNEEIKMIKKIVGLKEGVDYSNPANRKQLRYQHICIAADPDHDGDHIRGLFMNYIYTYWPALLKIPGFISTILLPVVKATKPNTKKAKDSKKSKDTCLSFYSMVEYHKWAQENNNGKGWKIKYYKGLGTFQPTEAREICERLVTIEYVWSDEVMEYKGKEVNRCQHKLDLAFAKTMEDDRKEWLNAGLLPEVPYVINNQDGPCTIQMTYADFIDHKLKPFSMADCVRSIPHIMDGFKPGQRKIIYTAQARGLKDEIKVVELAGRVNELATYHHAEDALHSTIINMAQDFVGACNVNLLFPAGSFGDRAGGTNFCKIGQNNASPRYISTCYTSLAPHIINDMDTPLLKHQTDDGKVIEPEYFVPAYPMILDGGMGIGTGWSTDTPSYNPEDVIANIKAGLNGEPMTEMHPWYRGYKGRIECIGRNKYVTIGKYMRTGTDTICVYELPVGAKNCKSFQQYQTFLNTLLDEETAKAYGVEIDKKAKKGKKGDSDVADETSVRSSKFKQAVVQDYTIIKNDAEEFVVSITFKEGVLERELANNEGYRFEKKMNLAHAFSSTNMHLYTCDGKIKKFNSELEILQSYMDVRLDFYERRRLYWIGKYKFEHGKASARYRYINEIMDDVLVIKRKKESECVALLEERGYPKYSTKVENQTNADDINYDYLLHMQTISFTTERLDKLEKEQRHLYDLYTKLESQTAKDMWNEDLDALLVAYKEYNEDWSDRHQITLLGPRVKVTTKTKPKAAPVKTQIRVRTKTDAVSVDTAGIDSETLSVSDESVDIEAVPSPTPTKKVRVFVKKT